MKRPCYLGDDRLIAGGKRSRFFLARFGIDATSTGEHFCSSRCLDGLVGKSVQRAVFGRPVAPRLRLCLPMAWTFFVATLPGRPAETDPALSELRSAGQVTISEGMPCPKKAQPRRGQWLSVSRSIPRSPS